MSKIKVHSCNNNGNCNELKNGDYQCTVGGKSLTISKAELKKATEIFLQEYIPLEEGRDIFKKTKKGKSLNLLNKSVDSISKTFCKAKTTPDLLDQMIELYISHYPKVNESEIRTKLGTFKPEVQVLIMKKKLLEIWTGQVLKNIGVANIDLSSPAAWTAFMGLVGLDETLPPKILDTQMRLVLYQFTLASIFFKYLKSNPATQGKYNTPHDVINFVSKFPLNTRIKILESKLVEIWAKKLGFKLDPKDPDAYFKLVGMISDPSGSEDISLLYTKPELVDKKVDEMAILINQKKTLAPAAGGTIPPAKTTPQSGTPEKTEEYKVTLKTGNNDMSELKPRDQIREIFTKRGMNIKDINANIEGKWIIALLGKCSEDNIQEIVADLKPNRVKSMMIYKHPDSPKLQNANAYSVGDNVIPKGKYYILILPSDSPLSKKDLYELHKALVFNGRSMLITSIKGL